MKTGPGFREEHTLRTGERIVVRHIQRDDVATLKEAYERLSSESRYRRFLNGGAALDDATLRYLADVDGKAHVAIVAVIESLDWKSERGVGVARFVRAKGAAHVAEIAVTVADDMQRKGVGARLLSTAVVAAHERGITRFRGEVLVENAAVVAILEEVGAERSDGPAGTLRFELDLNRGEPAFRTVLRLAAEHVSAFIRRLGPGR